MPTAISAGWVQLLLLAMAVCWSEMTGKSGGPAANSPCWQLAGVQRTSEHLIPDSGRAAAHLTSARPAFTIS